MGGHSKWQKFRLESNYQKRRGTIPKFWMVVTGDRHQDLRRQRVEDFARNHPGALCKEIAAHLGMSHSTVLKYMAQIREEWRRELRSKAEAKSDKM